MVAENKNEKTGKARADLEGTPFVVRDRFEPKVTGVDYQHDADVRPGPRVMQTLGEADGVIIGPSNPITSIGPILSVPGIRQAVCEAAAPVVCVSPIVGGSAVTGPAGKLMQAEGFDVSVAGVAPCSRRQWSPSWSRFS